MPEALLQRFLEVGGGAGTVVYEGEQFACWRFEELSGATEEETISRRVEQMIEAFKELRGEELCCLEGEPPEGDIQVLTDWWCGNLRRREQILTEVAQRGLRVASYEGQQSVQRALYRAANRHAEVMWWQTDDDGRKAQLSREWEEERSGEARFADCAFAERKKASGFRRGTRVRTLVVPKGARTVPVPCGTVGVIEEETELYWMVAFSLPLTESEGWTWLPHEEKTSLSMGYVTEELEKV